MRVGVLLLVILGALIEACAAAAQGDMTMMNQTPAQAHGQDTGPMAPPPSRHDRYLMRVASLRDKTLKMKAKDGGQLTPQHAASLQHELDELNRQFGIKPG